MSAAGRACPHAFSLELNSRGHIRRVSLPSGPGDRLLIQGCLGELEAVELVEGLMLEFRGSHGVLSLDIGEEELRTLLGARRSNADGHAAPSEPG